MSKESILKALYPSYDAMQVIGCICIDTELTNKQQYKLSGEDFLFNFHKVVFSSVVNMVKCDLKVVDSVAVKEYLKNFNATWLNVYEQFDINNNFIETVKQQANLDNFNYHYNRVRKFTMLRDMVLMGIDISGFYDITGSNQELNLKFEEMSVDDIIDLLSTNISNFKNKWTGLSQKGVNVHSANGLRDLIQRLKETPDFGLPLFNPVLSTAFRGARASKLVIHGSPSGFGKSRQALANAVKLAMPFLCIDGQWVENGGAESVLYITTELQLEEVQPTILSAITGINEYKIVEGELSEVESITIDKAITLLEQSKFNIVYIPDFNSTDIENIIESYVLKYETKYVFYDYLHLTPSIIQEMSGKGNLSREDLIILLFMTRLKEICNTYKIFMWVGSQLNRSSKETDNQEGFHSFKGSFSIGDKVDHGILSVAVTEKDIEMLKDSGLIVEEGFKSNKLPNICHVIVKNRGGRLKDIRIFAHINLGTLREEIICVTDKYLKPLQQPIKITDIIVPPVDGSEEWLRWLNS